MRTHTRPNHGIRRVWPVLMALVPLLYVVAVNAAPTAEKVGRLLEEAEYEEAVTAARELLSNARDRHGTDSLQAGEASQLLADAMASAWVGELGERVALAEHAVAVKRRFLDDDDPELAPAVYLLGLVHNLAGHPADALPHFEEALRIAERHYGALHPDLEVYIREYGVVLYGVGRHDEAKVEFGRLNAICRDKYGPGHPGTVKAIFNLAIVHNALGEFDEAERRFREAIDILEAQEKLDVATFTWALNSYANLLASRGLLREALEQADRVLQLRKQHSGSASEAVAWTLNDLASMQRKLGDYEGARAHLEQSLRLQQELNVSPTLAIKSRINLARIHRILGAHKRSQALFEEVEASLNDSEQSVRGRFHVEFGTLLVEVGDFARAREQFHEALKAWEVSIGRETFDYGGALASLAELDFREGQPGAARERLERALAILELRVGRQHPKTVETLGMLAAVHHALDKDDLALQTALAADDAARDVAAAVLAYLPERQALAHVAVHRRGRDVAVTLALASDATGRARAAAYDAVLRSRAIVFDEVTSRNRFYGAASDPELADLVNGLNDARTRLANLFVLDAGGDGRQLDEARREVERLETELARKSAAFRSHKAGRGFGLEALIEKLPERSACVSFLRYSRYGSTAETVASYVAIVLRAGSAAPAFVDLGAAETVDQAVAGWRATLRLPEDRYRRAAETLRGVLWDPVAEHVADSSVVYVVPDGAVQLVSFAALPVEEDAYLLERGPAFHYLTAERDLARVGHGESAARGLLIVGDPAFDDLGALTALAHVSPGSSTLRGFRTTAFGPLPGARAEAEAVDAIWRLSHGGDEADITVLVGGAATEAAFRAQAPGKHVLHLATHGYFLDDSQRSADGSRSVGGLTQREEPRAPVATAVELSPLLLSGLAFAGANRRGESRAGQDDGILTAEEVSAMGLAGVDLAVLSACRTGTGSVTEGEGVFGLRRAFLTSGVRSVVTNLWDVEDSAAQDWIESFYRRRFLSGESIPESMRAASLAVLEARREAEQTTHPFFWGGWLAVGAVE